MTLPRIFFPIAYFYPSQIGGPSNSIYWLSKALTNQGMDVIIVTTDKGIPMGAIPLNNWVKNEVGQIMYKTEISERFWPMLIWKSLFQLRRADIVHLTSIFGLPSLILVFFATLIHKKIVWSPRGELKKEALVFSAHKKKPILWLIKNFLAKRVVFHSTKKGFSLYWAHTPHKIHKQIDTCPF
jgi:hypothetical protein